MIHTSHQLASLIIVHCFTRDLAGVRVAPLHLIVAEKLLKLVLVELRLSRDLGVGSSGLSVVARLGFVRKPRLLLMVVHLVMKNS